MNKYDAKDYLPLVQALAEGKTIQRYIGNQGVDQLDLAFPRPYTEYRIKPNARWYRVALMKNEQGEYTQTADSHYDNGWYSENYYEFEAPEFVCWLTDRIEYDV